MLVHAISNALAWDIALIGIFVVVMGGLVNGLIVFAAVQAWGERRQNEQDRLSGR